MNNPIFLNNNSLYYDIVLFHASDIIFSHGMQSEKEYTQHGNTSCYDHSLYVTYMSLRIVAFFGLNVNLYNLIRGSLLHDYFLYDWHVPDKSHKLHGFHHAKKALANAEKDFSLNTVEKDIIFKHMFPLNCRFPKYKESVIVCTADKICTIIEVFGLNSILKKQKN